MARIAVCNDNVVGQFGTVLDFAHSQGDSRPMPTDPHAVCDKRTHRNSVLKELRELQTLAKSDCDNPETTPTARAQLMRAYVCLEQQRNVLRMRPAPKPIDVAPRKPRQSRQQSHAGPVDPATGQALGPG